MNQMIVRYGMWAAALMMIIAGSLVGAMLGQKPIEHAEAPRFSGWTAAGEEVTVTEYEGKVILLQFWATWCGPCVAKMPSIVALQEEFGPEGLQVIGVSADRSREELLEFEANNSLNFPTIFDGAEPILRGYGVQSLPTSFVIDQNGKALNVGFGGNLRQTVAQLLEE